MQTESDPTGAALSSTIVLSVCALVLVLNRRGIAFGSPEEALAEPVLRQAYGGLLPLRVLERGADRIQASKSTGSAGPGGVSGSSRGRG